jgi:hypothetical protein
MDLEDNETNLYEDGYPMESDQEGDEEGPTEYDGDSEAEEGVLFIRSTISQDDTKDMASKERSMLVQLTERLNSGGKRMSYTLLTISSLIRTARTFTPRRGTWTSS